jgi:hypothetical protein
MERAHEYAARLFLAWLNGRYRRSYSLALEGSVWRASEAGASPAAIAVAELFEADEAWDERCSALSRRLDETRPGSYLLWVPPGGLLPGGEPDESEWVRRVVLTASRLASGRRGEVRLPVKLALGKVRDEGGYASVTGALGRHWTNISSRLQGSFFLDSRGLHRFTTDEDEREALYGNIALLSQGVETGNLVEFEHEDAWTLQRLPRSEGMTDGWAITGCPPAFEPNDGGAIRRILRRRLAEAPEAYRSDEAIKVLVLIGAYDYMEVENAGPALRGFDPGLTAPFDVIALVADAEVKPILLKRGIFGIEASAT